MADEDRVNVQYDEVAKVVLVGDFGVGKTSLLLRYLENTFSEGEDTTVQSADMRTKMINTKDGKTIRLSFWDTAGEERMGHNLTTKTYYQSANGIIVVFDITNQDSFNNVRDWVIDIERYGTEALYALCLVGNKIDLDHRAVAADTAKAFCNEHQYLYMETSAKTGKNVDTLFNTIVEEIKTRKDNLKASSSKPDEKKKTTLNLNNPQPAQKKRCILI